MADMPSSGDDGQIIEKTVQHRNDKGWVQFEIVLPSGRKVNSEWLNEDQLKKALVPWVEAVKQQMQVDREEYDAERRRASIKQRAAKAADPRLVSASGDALTAEDDLLPSEAKEVGAATSRPSTSVAPSSSSPDSYIREGLDNARTEVAQLRADMARLQEALNKAAANLDKWNKLYAAIGGQEQDESEYIEQADSVVIGTLGGSGDLLNPAPRKSRGRPAGSRNKSVIVPT